MQSDENDSEKRSEWNSSRLALHCMTRHSDDRVALLGFWEKCSVLVSTFCLIISILLSEHEDSDGYNNDGVLDDKEVTIWEDDGSEYPSFKDDGHLMKALPISNLF
ncbi:hypothetical protein K1719_011419 [Acacia pycnantha]|nr:hypothetical protein K1719_011419 [Acacia pycnantha]